MDDRSAELDKLKSETRLIEAQTDKARAENNQKLQLEIAKMIAETEKIRSETRWYPLVVVGTFVAGVVTAVGALLFKLLHG